MRKTLMVGLLPTLFTSVLLTACGESGGAGSAVVANTPVGTPSPVTIPSPSPTPGPVVRPKSCITNAGDYNEMATAAGGLATTGGFGVPFCEEKFLSDYPDADIPDRGTGSGGATNPMPPSYSGLEHCARRSENKFYECKPTAGSIALLPDNRMVYFNALESTENVEFNIVKEFGDVAINDQTRVLTLNSNNVASWTRPINNDGGAKSPTNDGAGSTAGGTSPDDEFRNDGALFCAHLVNLHDGRVMAAGGTDYYTEAGAVELEGLKNTRIFDPANDTWTQADLMTWGRWYPTMVTMANGNVFVASGVRKLLKPVYADRPADESGRNETHTEMFQIGCNAGKGKWTDQGETGRRSLPLFARLHLLPNNEVLYAAGGQAFNPAGQSYDQALFWDQMAVFNAGTKAWRAIGTPGSAPFIGFRGSTSNVMMPLVPDASGGYNKVEFLTMGGTYGLSPGSPMPINVTRVDTVNLAAGVATTMQTKNVGNLTAARWYGSGVLMPTGKVMLFSGADLDEVISPGSGTPNLQTEMYDPAAGTWTRMALQGKARTYHNVAFMLPDGRIMVGGHGPISNNYSMNFELPGKSPQGRDPSFEIYSPPYMFKPRPSITSVSASTVAPGGTLTINTPNAASIAADGFVTLMRRTALTHLVDGDQRSVVLKINSSTGTSLTVQIPDNDGAKNQAVVPPGHYMLFVVNKAGDELVPSVSAPVLISGADLSCR